MSDPLPRKHSGWHHELMLRLWNGELEEEDLYSLLDDPTSEALPRFYALQGVASAHGDDVRATQLFRSILAEKVNPHPRKDVFQVLCLDGLARRDGANALTELNDGLRSRSPRVRFAAINGLTLIGDTSHYDEMLTLLTRAVKRGQGKAGGFFTDRLAQYVFSCLRQGIGDFDAFKVLIRSHLPRMPDDMQSLFRRFLPGIEDQGIPIQQVPLPVPESR
jgi:hypothetical protein